MKHIDYNKLFSKFSVPGGLKQTWLFVILMVASVALQAQPCSGPPSSAGTSSASSPTVCFGESVTLSSVGASTADGIIYQWYVSANSGGPYSAISGASSTTYSFNVASSTAFYVLSVKCSNTGDSVLSNEVQVTVSALSGTYTIGSPASCTQFASIADFLTALNTVGVSGPVTLNVPAGYTETTPTGGFAISQCGLAAGLRTSAANPLVIQKSGSGANPVITGAAGTGTKDGIFWLVGADYVTIDGINLVGSTAFSNASRHEFGYALVRCNGTDGAQNNIIKNCTINLDRGNIVSRGIYSGSITRDSIAVTVTATSGTNSNNAFYGNTVRNAFHGIWLSAFNAPSPYTLYDQNNIIGASGMGNTIELYGNTASAATGIAIGIYTELNNNTQIRYNTINCIDHSGSIYGIQISSARWASMDVTHNSITIATTATTGAANVYAIVGGAGSRTARTNPVTNTINISNNTIQNCGVSSGSTGSLAGFVNSKPTADSLSCHTINITSNNFIGNTNASTGSNSAFAMVFALNQLASNQVNITGNTCTNNQLTGSSSSAGAGNRMIVTGAPGNTRLWECSWNIANNTFTNNGVSAPGGIMTGIAMESYSGSSMLSGSITINGNTVTGVTQSTASATGTFTGITCGAQFNTIASATALAVSITNNTVSNIVRTASTTGNFVGITLGSGYPSSVTMTGNQVINNSIGGTATGTTGIFTGISVGGGNLAFYPAVVVSNNTVSGNTHNGNGASTLMSAGGIDLTMNNNTISNHIKTKIPSSTTTALLTGMTIPAGVAGIYTLSGNTIENLRILGISGVSTDTINGILNNGASGSETISNNTIKTLFASGTADYTARIFGIRSPGSSVASRSVSGNTIGDLYNTGGHGVIRGIRSEDGNSVSIFKNKIYDIYPGTPSSTVSSTSSATGISITSGTQHKIYNNLIGLRFDGLINVPSYTGDNAVTGIEVANTNASHNINLHYNTIRLSGSPGVSGSTFGSSGISVTSATPPIVEIVNNIINNLVVPGGVPPGFSVAYRRASALTNSNYSEFSNNNLYFSGTPSAGNLIFFDGTNSDQTISAFRARAGALSPPRDNLTVSQSITFLNTSNGPANTFLHIDPAVANLAEAGARILSSITDDYDGDIRSTTAPDIGADEGSFISLRPTISSVNITPSTPQCTAVPHSVTVVTSNGASPITGVSLAYSYNGVLAGTIAMASTGPNTWSATIPAATTPANAQVTWTVTATDGMFSPSQAGTPYQDAYLSSPVSIILQPSVCQGNPITAVVTKPIPVAPTNYCSTTYSNADEDFISLVNVVGTTLNNATGNSLPPFYSNYNPSGSTTGTLAAGTPLTMRVAGGTYSVCYIRGWIDYNHDGLFSASESFGISGNVGSSSVGTFQFTIPTSAFNGPTRMRLRSSDTGPGPSVNDFCSITNSGYGETEDYTITIVGAQSYALPNNFISFNWTDGTNSIANTNPATITPASSGNISYTVLLVDSNNCTTSSVTNTVSVNPLPPVPSVVTNPVQCGAGVPKAKVSGGVAYNWYLQPSGGTPVQSAFSDSLTSYSISVTTDFYVSSIDPNTNCESARATVTVTVLQPNAISLSSSSSTVCPGSPVTLTVNQTGNTNNYAFSWSGNGLVNTSGSQVTATPTVVGNNTYQVNAFEASTGCAAVATITVVGSSVPVSLSASATPSVVCFGDTVRLSGGPNLTAPSYCAVSHAAGTGEPLVTSVSFNTLNSTVPAPASPYYTIIPPTGANTTTVNTGQTYTLQLTSSSAFLSIISVWFDWNRNGIYESTEWYQPWTNNNTGSISVTVPLTAGAGLTGMRVRTRATNSANAGGNACTTFGSGSTVDYKILVDPNPGATYAWTYNGNLVGSGTTFSHVPTVAGTAQYTSVVTGANGCTSSFPASPVTVNPAPPAPSTTPSTQCGSGVPTASVTSVSGLSNPIFKWYTSATGGTPIQTGSSTVLNSYIVSATTTLYISETNSITGCEGARKPVLITVNQPDSVAVSVSPGPYCLGGSITLNATNTGSTNNYTYSWNGSPSGSGFNGAISGPTATVTPTAAGTYTYTMTATDGLCTYISIRNVNISALPTIQSVTSTPSGTACSGTNVILKATGSVSNQWTWNPGALTGDSVVVNPTSFTTYTVTATNPAGCTSTSSVSINTAPLPSSPITLDGSRCGFGPANVGVISTTGAVTPVFNWYTSATGGTPIQTGPATSLTNYNVSVTDTFWVAEINLLSTPNCESPRIIVIQEVNQPDSVSATASSTFVCLPTNAISLNATKFGNGNNYTYTWSSSPAAGSGLVSGAQGASQTIVPTQPGTYVYSVIAVDGLCAYQSSVSIAVNTSPTKPNLGPDQVVCAGTDLTFSVFDNSFIGGGIQSNASNTTGEDIFNVTISGTILNNNSTCSTIAPGALSSQNRYSNYTTTPSLSPTLVPGNSYSGSLTIGQCSAAASACGFAVFIDINRNGQFDLPQERVAAGPAVTASVAGTVFPFSFSIPANAAPGLARMRIIAQNGADGTTGAILPNGPYLTGETEDYAVRIDLNPGATYQWTSIPTGFSSTATTIVTGPIPSSTTYAVTVTNQSGCTVSDSIAVTAIITPDVPLYTATSGGFPVDTLCGSGTVTFTITNFSGGVSYQWQSATSANGPWTNIFGANNTSFITPTLAPVLGDTAVYYRVVSSCGATATPSAVKLVYVAKPSISAAANVTRCGPGTVTLNATGVGNIDWYNAPTGGASLGSGSSFTTTVTGSITYYVGASRGSCSVNQRTVVNVTVTPAPAISASASPATVCEGGSTTLSVSSSNSGYTYMWDSSVSGATYNVTPATSTIYVVSALDAATGCAAIANIGVTVNKNPVISSITSDPAVVCNDLPFTLNANSVVSGPQSSPSGYCAAAGGTANSNQQIFGVTFAGMNNLNQGETCASNNSDYTSVISPVTINAGSSYPFSVITDECDGAPYSSSGLSIFIDYNRDGDWNDIGEEVYTTTVTAISPNTNSGTISIPFYAALGVTRMRVIVVEGVASPGACGSFTSGEAEDYLVNIVGPASTFSWSPANLLTNATSATPSCQGINAATTFTVTATSNAGCTATGSINISVAPGPQPVITTNDTTFCAPNEITIRVADAGPFSGGYPSGTTFEWLGITPPIAGLDTVSSINGSIYSVVVTLPSGCADTSNVRNIVTRTVAIVENIIPGTCLNPNGTVVATVASNGGSAPFNYVWSTDAAQTSVIRNVTTSSTVDSLIGFAPGTYYLKVADLVGNPAGCVSGVLSYMIGAPLSVNANATSTDITCNGASDGSATVSWTGGTAPFNILWSNGATASSITVTAAANLSVIVSDNGGCADTTTVTVAEPAPVQLTLSYTPASAPGALDGTATVVVNGGSAPYSYDWIDANNVSYSGSTITGLAAGSYFSLVTDANNCQSTIGSVAVGSNGRLTVTAFIEGFYDGAGGMYPVLLNNGSVDPTETDSIRIELRDPLNVSTAVAGGTTVIKTSGQASIIIPESLLTGSYYIAVSHRNAVETWSAAPVSMSLLATYDFTTAASQAYGDNMINLGGVFAFFSGDLAPQDLVVDIFDQVPLDNDISNFNGGYIVTDLNGDGVTDLFDQVLMDNNIANFIGSAQPN